MLNVITAQPNIDRVNQVNITVAGWEGPEPDKSPL
jgi:hypothetical protein